SVSLGVTPHEDGWLSATSSRSRRNTRLASSRSRAGARPTWWCSSTSARSSCRGSVYRVSVPARGAAVLVVGLGSTRSTQKLGSPHSSQMLPPVDDPQVGQPPPMYGSYRY